MAAAASLSRRHAILGGLCLCCAPLLARGARVEAGRFPITEIAQGIYVRRGIHEEARPSNAGGIANIGFIVGRDAVAVTDPGGSLTDGERLRERIREVTDLPIRYVMMSHVHPDHIFGAGAFEKDEPQFVGHAHLESALAQRGNYYRERLGEILGMDRVGPVITPTLLIEDRAEIDLGERVLALTAHALAHTDCDLSVFDRETGTLFASDLLFVERVPSLDGSLRGWLEELTALQAVRAQRAVPGHGPASVDWPQASRDLQRYLGTLLRETREAVASGVEIERAVGTVARSERGKWKLFDEYHGRNVTQAFKEIEWE